MSGAQVPSNPAQTQSNNWTSERIILSPRLSPQPNANVKLKLFVEITNLTPTDIVISSASFRFIDPSSVRFDPFMRRHVDAPYITVSS